MDKQECDISLICWSLHIISIPISIWSYFDYLTTVQRHGTRSESIAVRSKVRPRKYHVNMVVVEARRAADVRMQPIRMHFFCFVPCSRSQCSTAFRRVCHFLHVCPPGSLALPHSISCPHATDESCPRLSITVSKFLSNRRYKRKSLRRIINQNIRRATSCCNHWILRWEEKNR